MLRFPVFSITAATSATTFREGHTSRDVRIVCRKVAFFRGRKSSLPPVAEDPPWSVSLGSTRSCVCSTAGSHCRKVELLGLAFLRLGHWGHGGTLAMVVLKTTGWMGEHWQCGIMWTSGRTFRNGLCSGTWSYVILNESWKIRHFFFFKVRQPVLSQLFRLWYCSHDPKYLIL